MKEIVSKNRAITLISLVITIIVLLVLVGISLNGIFGENGLIKRSRESVTTQKLAEYKEQFELSDTDKYFENTNNAIFAEGEEVLSYIPGIDSAYIGKIGILNGELVYFANDNEEEMKIAQSLGYTIIESDIYRFYRELQMLEQATLKIQEQKNATNDTSYYKGLAVATNEYPNVISILGITYGYGWHFIDVATAEEMIGISIDSSRSNGFIVKYTTGEVVSIDGKLIEGNIVHSINYTGIGENQLYVVGLLTGVGADSIKTSTSWGESKVLNGTATYDEKGGLILGTQLGSVTIDQTKPVGEKYSINVTVKGVIPQTNIETFPRSIVAISDQSGAYLSWIGVRNKYLHIYSFYGSQARGGIDKEETIAGFISIDLTKPEYGFDFNNKYLNIQITAERGKQTKLYINGEHFKTFASGDGKLSYGSMTVGDLRSNPIRNLRFEGAIYNLALYSDIIEDYAINHNWEYSKWQLGIQ